MEPPALTEAGRSPILLAERLEQAFPSERDLFGRPRSWVRAVNGISLRIEQGEILGLAGESGSGKSTLARIVAGVDRARSGSMYIAGRPTMERRVLNSEWFKKRVQMVFQDPISTLNPRRTVDQTLDLPLRIFGVPSADRPAQIRRLLSTVELDGAYADQFPHSLSGGGRQRVAIARALAVGPSLIVLDEPTSALDVSVQAKVIRLLLGLRERLGLSYLFITHDLGLLRNVADMTAIMYLGRIVESGLTAQVFKHPLHPYTQMLLSAIPVVSEYEQSLKPIRMRPTGEIPSATHIPTGCSFHTRCPAAMDVCSRATPELLRVGDSHKVACHLHTDEIEQTR